MKTYDWIIGGMALMGVVLNLYVLINDIRRERAERKAREEAYAIDLALLTELTKPWEPKPPQIQIHPPLH